MKFTPSLPKGFIPRQPIAKKTGTWLAMMVLFVTMASSLMLSLKAPNFEDVPKFKKIARVEVKVLEQPQAPQPPKKPKLARKPPKLPPQKLTQKPRPLPPKKTKTRDLTPSPRKLKRTTAAFKSKGPRKSKGLNSPVKRGKANQVGVLDLLKLKSSNLKESKVRADMILNQGINQNLNRNTSGFKLKRSPAGQVIPKGAKRSGSQKDGNLSQAMTTLSAKNAFSKNLATPLSSDGQANFDSDIFSDTGSGSGNFFKGGLSRRMVLQALVPFRSQIRKCYEAALVSSPKLKGRMRYRWIINSRGKVLSAKTVISEIKFPRLDRCIRETLVSITFPSSGNNRSTTVEYTFNFKKGKGGK